MLLFKPHRTASKRPTPGSLLVFALAVLSPALASDLFSQTSSAKPGPARLAQASAAMRDGMAATDRNDLAAAHRFFARAVQLAPNIEAAHAALGAVLLAQDDLQAAAHELERAHTLSSADVSATLNLARTRSNLGDHPAALGLFRQALGDPTPPTLTADEALAYSTSLSATGHTPEAQVQLNRALQHTPDSAPLHDALGLVLAQSGHLDQASLHFEQAATLDPSLAPAQLHLGTSRLGLGRPREAIDPLQHAAAAMPNSFDAHLQLGRALSALHEDGPALAELHHAAILRSTNTNPEATYSLALALEASGNFAASLPLFASATAARAGGTDAVINYALARVQTGDAAGALPLYARALQLGPDTPTLREDYGVAYLQQADLDHAIAQFHAGLALDPQSAHLHYNLGLAFKLKDDLTQAISELQRAASLDAALPDPAYTLGVIYMQQGRYPEAITQLRRVVTLQPANGEAWALLGGVLKDSASTDADDDDAVDALQHATALQPDLPSLHVQLASLLVRMGQPEQAAAERNFAAELSRAAVSQQRASFALKSGRTLLIQGKLPEAVVQLHSAVAADPKLIEAHTLLAEALSRQGKSAEAAQERERAASLHAPTP